MKSGNKNNISAFVRTSIVFVAMLLLLLFIKLYTPNPPYPEAGGGPGEGLEINLGVDEKGSEPQPEVIEELENEDIAVDEQPETVEEKLLTSDDQESEAIKETPKIEQKKTIKEPIVKPVVKPIEKKVEKTEPVKDPVPTVNKKALYGKPRNASSGDGNTSQSGNQGAPNGSEASGNYTGGGSGSGNGSGSGTGTGTGNGTGSGVSYSLAGRSPQSLPIPEYNNQVEGKVVVKIIVDSEGRVVSAVPGVKGSTTLDEYLLSVAKNAALKARFSRKSDAPDNQEGTLTYKFILQ